MNRGRLKSPRSVSPTVRTIFHHIDARDLSQNRVAQAAGFTAGMLNGWRRGANSPGIINLELLADVLGLEIIVREKRP